MRKRNKSTLTVLFLIGAFALSGCSSSKISDKITGDTDKAIEESDSKAKKDEKKDTKKVDGSLEKPNFTANLEGQVQYVVGKEADPLTVEASVGDGGTISYQWYSNNVNSNGGGEQVEGQTQNTYVPDTSAEGTRFYYVVATNTKEDSISKSTSATVEVQILPEGSWVEDGGYKKYKLQDGSFVTNAWKDIGGKHYLFDENGNMKVGWYQDGNGDWYYMNPDGNMARDTEVEGFKIGSDGKSEDKKKAEQQSAGQ